MVAEPTEATYTDEELESLIEAKALRDSDGNEPDDDDWTATYDLFAVASEVWMEKASAFAEEFDFTADGGSFSRSQKIEHCVKMSGLYKSRSAAFTLKVKQVPITTTYDDMAYKDEPHDPLYY
jgi:hypothetical protein